MFKLTGMVVFKTGELETVFNTVFICERKVLIPVLPGKTNPYHKLISFFWRGGGGTGATYHHLTTTVANSKPVGISICHDYGFY